MLVALAVGQLDQAQPVAAGHQAHGFGVHGERAVGECDIAGQVFFVEMDRHCCSVFCASMCFSPASVGSASPQRDSVAGACPNFNVRRRPVREGDTCRDRLRFGPSALVLCCCGHTEVLRAWVSTEGAKATAARAAAINETVSAKRQSANQAADSRSAAAMAAAVAAAVMAAAVAAATAIVPAAAM